jgi:phosphoribosylformimino-5-aminoimidazole carboxamide ribotide isomerase
MIIIPAIDIKEGKCVRLRRGDMASAVIFNEDPVDQAKMWRDSGAERIHIVDLDGSVEGRPVNIDKIESIVKAVAVPVELGGGIRDEAVVNAYLNAGVDTVILGTLLIKEPETVEQWLRKYPGKIALGIDALNGFVAVQGWTEATAIKAGELAARFDDLSPWGFIYTDIDRDGMMKGPNFSATEEFAESVKTPVVLSGGVSTYRDIDKALPLENSGVMGIIIGRALYEGSIRLKQAIQMVK